MIIEHVQKFLPYVVPLLNLLNIKYHLKMQSNHSEEIKNILRKTFNEWELTIAKF